MSRPLQLSLSMMQRARATCERLSPIGPASIGDSHVKSKVPDPVSQLNFQAYLLDSLFEWAVSNDRLRKSPEDVTWLRVPRPLSLKARRNSLRRCPAIRQRPARGRELFLGVVSFQYPDVSSRKAFVRGRATGRDPSHSKAEPPALECRTVTVV